MLSHVKKKKSTGYDALPAKILKIGSDVLAPSLTSLVNNVIDESQFPNAMKYAEISPIFKKEDSLDKSKYRPVSILTCTSKIFEKILDQQFGEHFYACNAQCLSAYRKHHNTQSMLLRAIEDWKASLDQGKCVGALLMDLSKAFNVIPHGLLIAKLKAYGYDDNVVKLIRCYLYDRKQCVKIDNMRSEWTVTNMGVPQGSILGPTLFNVFLNDLFFIMKEANIYNYADDNTLSHGSVSPNELAHTIEKHGNEITDWFKYNGMKANPDKYQTIVFGNRRDLPSSFKIKNVDLPCHDSVKLLGIHIDQTLSLNKHAIHVCQKASKQVNAMMRLCNVLDTSSKKAIYDSFIISNFTYCPLVWLMCSKVHLKKAEKIQCRALRFVYYDFKSPYEDLLSQGNHRSVSVILLHAIAIEVYKCLNELSPKYMTSMFENQFQHYEVRSRYNLKLKKFNTLKYGYNSFTYLGAKVWNNLPNCVKEAATITSFKTKLMNWKDASCLDRMV